MHARRSITALASISERLLRNEVLQASCSYYLNKLECFNELPFPPTWGVTRGLATGPAVEAEKWQESGIKGAKSFDVTSFPQEKVSNFQGHPPA